MTSLGISPVSALRVAVLCIAACVCACGREKAPAPTIITVLHSSDGESHLWPTDEYPGVSHFVGRWEQMRAEERKAGHAVLAVCAGDTFLPSALPTAKAHTLQHEAAILRMLEHDAVALGNHDFDLGAAFLAEFIAKEGTTPFLSANCDFTGEPALQAQVNAGRLRGSIKVRIGSVDVGLIGIVTPTLASISTVGHVTVRQDVAACVNEQAQTLRRDGAKLVVVVSHLQGVHHERALIASLHGVDVVVAGGGEEFLGPADMDASGAKRAGAYPQRVPAADGRSVVLVTAPGGYRYIGRLQLEVGANGRVQRVVSGGPVRITAGTPDARALRIEEAAATRAGNRARVVAHSDVALNGERAALRSGGTNLGRLVADAMAFDVRRGSSVETGVTGTVVLANAGGIRIAATVPAGPITEDVLDRMLPYPNQILRVVVKRDNLRDLLEHAAAALGKDEGVFAQVSGIQLTIDPTKTPRVRSARLLGVDTAAELISDGVLVPGPPVHVVATDFLVKPRGETGRGGDGYPFGTAPIVDGHGASVSFHAAVVRFLQAPVSDGGLGGQIRAAQYGGSNELITIVK